MADFEVKIDLGNVDRLINDLDKVKKINLDVGVEEGLTYDNGTPIAEVATYLEYGWVQSVTGKQRGWLAHTHNIHLKTNTLTMPPRPIFGYTARTRKGTWQKVGARLLKNFVLNPYQVAFNAFEQLGIMAVQDLQTTIHTNGKGTFAARSPLTLLMYGKTLDERQPKGTRETLKKRNISLKNNSDATKALELDGRLLRSITYDINGI